MSDAVLHPRAEKHNGESTERRIGEIGKPTELRSKLQEEGYADHSNELLSEMRRLVSSSVKLPEVPIFNGEKSSGDSKRAALDSAGGAGGPKAAKDKDMSAVAPKNSERRNGVSNYEDANAVPDKWKKVLIEFDPDKAKNR